MSDGESAARTFDAPPIITRRVRPCLRFAACGMLALAAACTTVTNEELTRTAELKKTQSAYRPGGALPALPALSANSSIDDVAQYAVLRSPRVEERFHAWARAVAEVTLARSLPDPTLSFGVEVERMLEVVRAGIAAMFPGPGKLALAAEAQSHVAAARRHEFEQAALAAAFQARVVWWRAAWLGEVVDVRREALGLAREIEELAATQYGVGKVSQQDVLRAQIERDQLETELLSIEDSRHLIVAELQFALGVPAQEPAPPLPERMPVTASQLADENLLESALRANHELLALREEIAEAESLVALARKSGQPDFMLGVGVDLLSPRVVMPEVGATLPIYRDKTAAMVAAALASRHAADARLAGATLELVVELADARFRYRDAVRRLELVRERLLPKARAALDAARAAYRTGMTDMTGLLDAERSLLEFRLLDLTSRLERESAFAEISLLILASQPTPSG